ncbi:uncharacterized protein BO97DRAFT_183048 [Aspergillus homomorphus CBS 101889]|uniref:Uncharacterized protein n=1 Tax=Aspergillus homomorphus (strain CBS 101889) TaxID=1450537 RepID=A0A395I7C3_ASPHC|nr:hypothetical protein BO97DRAFT_183048 [Aspergillus homomorphus CBS 101889]RAL16100.1 hypothetical protein BO97DRAFT_183048 [Aspergillus homomorphus CBS 101889]
METNLHALGQLSGRWPIGARASGDDPDARNIRHSNKDPRSLTEGLPRPDSSAFSSYPSLAFACFCGPGIIFQSFKPSLALVCFPRINQACRIASSQLRMRALSALAQREFNGAIMACLRGDNALSHSTLS